MPSGYGGHVPAVKHDMIYKNTQFPQIETLYEVYMATISMAISMEEISMATLPRKLR